MMPGGRIKAPASRDGDVRSALVRDDLLHERVQPVGEGDLRQESELR